MVPLLIVVSGFLCIELSLPIAVGEFIAGIIGGQILDHDETQWMQLFSRLGLLSIMFLAGFEVDVKVMKANLRTNLLVGVSSFIVPYLGVLIVCVIWGIPLHMALIVGVALSTTSLAMVYSILKEANLIHQKEGQVLLGSAMIVDLLSMIFLSITLFDFKMENLIFLGILIGIILVAKRFIMAIFQRYRGNRVEFELKTLMIIFPVMGLVAEEAGIHGAILAFILGILFSDIDPEHEEIIEKLNTVVFSLLAPIFFFNAGTQIQFGSIDISTLMLMLVLGTVAIMMKYYGTQLPLYLAYGRNKQLSKFGGILFNYPAQLRYCRRDLRLGKGRTDC